MTNEPEKTESVATTQGSDLRARILERARSLFAEHGYGSTSIRSVCEGVGCTKPALYYYFASKEVLFAEAARSTLRGFVDLTAEAVACSGTVAERLEAFARAYFDHCKAHPEAVRLLIAAQHGAEPGQPEVDLISLHIRNGELLLGLLREGVRAGEVRSDIDLPEATIALVGMVHTRVMAHLSGLRAPADAPHQIVDLFIHGISTAHATETLP